MAATQGSTGVLEDFKVPVKLKISALWVAIMFCYVYGDIFVLQQPGHLQELIAGTVWFGGPLTQNLLLAFAVSMAIPSVMIFLSLVLTPRINRWLNISLGVLFVAFMGMILAVPGAWYFYIFLSAVEIVLTLLIVWYAWKWPRAAH